MFTRDLTLSRGNNDRPTVWEIRGNILAFPGLFGVPRGWAKNQTQRRFEKILIQSLVEFIKEWKRVENLEVNSQQGKN